MARWITGKARLLHLRWSLRLAEIRYPETPMGPVGILALRQQPELLIEVWRHLSCISSYRLGYTRTPSEPGATMKAPVITVRESEPRKASHDLSMKSRVMPSCGLLLRRSAEWIFTFLRVIFRMLSRAAFPAMGNRGNKSSWSQYSGVSLWKPERHEILIIARRLAWSG